MAHTFRQKSQLLQQTGTTINHDHTPGAAATVAILTIAIESTTARSGGDPTIDGVTATQVGTSQLSTEARHEMWYVCKAFAGTAFTVSVPNAGGLVCNLEVVTADAGSGFSSVYNSFDEDQGAAGTEDSCVLTAAPAAVGDFLYASIMSDENANASVSGASGTNWDAGLVQVYSDDLGNESGMSHYSIADSTAGASTITYTFLNAGYAAHAVVFKSGVAPVERTPPVGSLTTAGFALALAFSIIVPTGSAAVQGYAPTAQLGISASPPVCTTTIQGYAPTTTTRFNTFDDSRAAIVQGLVSAQSDTNGWNEDVIDAILADLSVVERTSDTVVTITLPAVATFDISQTHTVTATVPLAAVQSSTSDIVASPTFDITQSAAPLQPPIGTATLAGYAPSLAITLPVPVGQPSLTGYAPTVQVGISASPPVGSVAVTGYAPSLDTAIAPPVGSLVTAGAASTVLQGIVIEPPVLSVAAVGYVPQQIKTLEIPSGTIVVDGYAPQIGGSTAIEVPVGAVAVTGYAPTRVVRYTAFADAISAIILGLDSAQSEGTGWDAVVKAALEADHTKVVRTSDTVVTITLPACGTYSITANETITVTIPVAALVSSTSDIVASPTFGITEMTAVEIQPPAGAGTLQGYAPTIQQMQAVQIEPPTCAVIVTGYAPDWTEWSETGEFWTATAPTGTVTLEGYAPEVLQGAVITPPVGSVAVTGYAPQQDVGVVVPVRAVDLLGYAPDVQQAGPGDTPITPPVEELSVVGYAPTLNTGISTPVGIVTVIGAQPTVGTGISVPVGSVTIAGYAPAQVKTVTPATCAVVVEGSIPQTGGNIVLQPPVCAVVVTGVVAIQATQVPVPVGSASAQGIAPYLDKGIAPPTRDAIITGYVPVLAKTVTPATCAILAEGQLPQIGGNISIQPPVCSVVVTGYVPSQGHTANVPAGSAALAGVAPWLDTGIVPAVRAVVIVGQLPTIGGTTQIQPPVGSLSAQGYVSVQDAGIPTPSGAAEIAGVSPQIDTGIVPSVGTVTVTGYVSDFASSSPVIAPATGALTFTGYVGGAMDNTLTGERIRFLSGRAHGTYGFSLSKKTIFLSLYRYMRRFI